MSEVTFADIVHQSISFSQSDAAERLLLSLVDTPWFQRLRDISQTANTRLVYMFSEHSRFGHSLGVAHLAKLALDKLAITNPTDVREYRAPILVAALLHDIGHLAPGSHTAFKTWFPSKHDCHEDLGARIIQEDPVIRRLLDGYSRDLSDTALKILMESEHVPPWTWQIISGGGWNVDRGNWSLVDSVMAGVSYGKYNIPALVDSIRITDKKHLALRENRLDAMMHFVVSRHAMYRQIYLHRVILATDMINKAIVQRARDLGDSVSFADDTMKTVLATEEPETLALETIFRMREPWWRYHLMRWMDGNDATLADLSSRLINRRLFKTIRLRGTLEERNALRGRAEASLAARGLDHRYYLHELSTSDVHAGDTKQSILVQREDGLLHTLGEADPLFPAMVSVSASSERAWLAVPSEVKDDLGHSR
jgi:HD superfamily phosphohydrolase